MEGGDELQEGDGLHLNTRLPAGQSRTPVDMACWGDNTILQFGFCELWEPQEREAISNVQGQPRGIAVKRAVIPRSAHSAIRTPGHGKGGECARSS